MSETRRVMGARPLLAGAVMAALAIGAWAQGGRFGGNAANRQPLEFRNLGPAVGGGRVCCVAGIPGQPDIYYVGAAAGGVWKTTDGGYTWTPIFQNQPVASIGAIALAPSNPNLIWVGTGEAAIRNDVMVGHGVYFSPDAGATWQEIAPDVFHNAGQISSLIVNPDNPNEVWVGVLGHAWAPNAERGVYHTTDGGKTWQKTLYVNETTGVSDMTLQPGNPRVLVAGMWQAIRYPWTLDDGGPGSGIYKSVDSGVTWHRIDSGLAPGPYGRIGVGFAPSAPNRIYALVQAKTGLFYRSDDAGDHWTAVNDSDQLDARPFYFSRFAVAPDNPDRIYFLSTNLVVSNDGGKTVEPLGRVHSDNHSIWIDPKDPNRIIEGNDGGVYTSQDAGTNFHFWNNIPIEEEYMVSASPEVAYSLCAGLQDNSAWCGPSQPAAGTEWRTVVGGDGEYAVYAPTDPHIIYADSQNGDIVRLDTATGVSTSVQPYLLGVESMPAKDLKYRFNWTTPIEVSYKDANEVYIGGSQLFKSTDGGWSWTPISPDLTRNDKSKQGNPGGNIVWDITGAETYDTILSFALSPVDPNTIWVGTDDGLVQATFDGGKTWKRVSDNIQGLPEWGRVQQIETSPFDPKTCYVAFDFHESDDNRPYVYKTHDGGQTWTSIATGLPADASARVVREDPNQKGFLVVGTDTGLFYSRDDGANWTPLQYGFPTVPVFDLTYVKETHDLVVATHGRGFFVLDDIVPLEQMTPEVTASDFHLFPVLTDYRFHGGRGGGGGRGAGGAPPQGVVINYYLKDAVRGGGAMAMAGGGAMAQGGGRGRGGRGGGASGGPVSITITDLAGQPVAKLGGPGRAGLNQVIWRGNYDGPRTLTFAGGRGGGGGFGGGGAAAGARPGEPVPDAGPAALAGTYKVTVTVPGEPPQSEEAVIKEDPRVTTNPAAFKATLDVALQMRDQVSALAEMLNRLNSMQTQLNAAERTLALVQGDGGAYRPLMQQGNALLQKVSDLEDQLYHADAEKNEATADVTAFYQQFNTLYQAVDRGWNEMPRPSDLALWGDFQPRLQQYVDQYNTMLKTDVEAFNRAAAAGGAITVVAGDPITLPSTKGTLSASRRK